MNYLDKLEQYNHEVVMDNKRLAKMYKSIVSESAGVPLDRKTDKYQGITTIGNGVENTDDLTPDDNLKIDECGPDGIVTEDMILESWFSRACASVGTGFIDLIKAMGKRLFIVLSGIGLGAFFGYPGLIIGVLLALGIIGRQVQKGANVDYDTIVTEDESPVAAGEVTPEKKSLLKRIVEFLKTLSKDTIKKLNDAASKGWEAAKKVGQDIVDTVRGGQPTGVVSEAMETGDNVEVVDNEDNENNVSDTIDGIVDGDSVEVADDDGEDENGDTDLTVVDDDVPVDGEDEDTEVVPITDEVKQQIIDLGVDTAESDCRFSIHFESEDDENFQTVLEILAENGITGAVAVTDFGTYIAVAKECDDDTDLDDDPDGGPDGDEDNDENDDDTVEIHDKDGDEVEIVEEDGEDATPPSNGGTGGLADRLKDPRVARTLGGAAVGAIGGGLIGHLSTKDPEKRKKRRMMGALAGAGIGGYAGYRSAKGGAGDETTPPDGGETPPTDGGETPPPNDGDTPPADEPQPETTTEGLGTVVGTVAGGALGGYLNSRQLVSQIKKANPNLDDKVIQKVVRDTSLEQLEPKKAAEELANQCGISKSDALKYIKTVRDVKEKTPKWRRAAYIGGGAALGAAAGYGVDRIRRKREEDEEDQINTEVGVNEGLGTAIGAVAGGALGGYLDTRSLNKEITKQYGNKIDDDVRQVLLKNPELIGTADGDKIVNIIKKNRYAYERDLARAKNPKYARRRMAYIGGGAALGAAAGYGAEKLLKRQKRDDEEDKEPVEVVDDEKVNEGMMGTMLGTVAGGALGAGVGALRAKAGGQALGDTVRDVSNYNGVPITNKDVEQNLKDIEKLPLAKHYRNEQMLKYGMGGAAIGGIIGHAADSSKDEKEKKNESCCCGRCKKGEVKARKNKTDDKVRDRRSDRDDEEEPLEVVDDENEVNEGMLGLVGGALAGGFLGQNLTSGKAAAPAATAGDAAGAAAPAATDGGTSGGTSGQTQEPSKFKQWMGQDIGKDFGSEKGWGVTRGAAAGALAGGLVGSKLEDELDESMQAREARAQQRIRENVLQTREEFFQNKEKQLPESVQNMLQTNKKLFTGK